MARKESAERAQRQTKPANSARATKSLHIGPTALQSISFELSDVQQQLLTLIALGLTIDEMALKTKMSPVAVNLLLDSIQRALGAASLDEIRTIILARPERADDVVLAAIV